MIWTCNAVLGTTFACVSLKIIAHLRTFDSQSDSSIQRPRSIIHTICCLLFNIYIYIYIYIYKCIIINTLWNNKYFKQSMFLSHDLIIIIISSHFFAFLFQFYVKMSYLFCCLIERVSSKRLFVKMIANSVHLSHCTLMYSAHSALFCMEACFHH